MLFCDTTFLAPAENLACDEALLEHCEQTGLEMLRFWEPSSYFAVVGYANKAATEVNLEYCRQEGIPVLRRFSGGGTVLQGPGCLNYALILRFDSSGPLSTIPGTNSWILNRHCQVLSSDLSLTVNRSGQTDLVIGALKFSGNAQRRRKDFLLFHGTFLLEFDIPRIQRALPMPSRQPEYRRNRGHSDFLMNLQVPAQRIKAALARAWSASMPFSEVPNVRIQTLVRERYGTAEWNLRF